MTVNDRFFFYTIHVEDPAFAVMLMTPREEMFEHGQAKRQGQQPPNQPKRQSQVPIHQSKPPPQPHFNPIITFSDSELEDMDTLFGGGGTTGPVTVTSEFGDVEPLGSQLSAT